METSLQTVNHKQKVAVWSERIAECRSSGQSVSGWCTENSISPASYYKWQKQIFQIAATNAPQFVELAQSTRAAAVAVLHMGDGEVELREGIDEKTLAMICRCLRKC